MNYQLKNGKTVTIRKPVLEDARQIIEVIAQADTETPFLARNPGEFQTTAEQERVVIERILQSQTSTWFLAEIENRIVGQCSVGLVRGYQRYQHRAEVAFLLLKDYCNMGIGGKLMLECLNWCKEHHILQVELDVVTTI